MLWTFFIVVIPQHKTGLPISTYFSAVKLRWLMDNVEEVREAVVSHRAMFGTVDSWLIWVKKNSSCVTAVISLWGRQHAWKSKECVFFFWLSNSVWRGESQAESTALMWPTPAEPCCLTFTLWTGTQNSAGTTDDFHQASTVYCYRQVYILGLSIG